MQLLATASTQPLQSVGQYFGRFLDVKVSWDRLREPFSTPILPVVKADAAPCPPLSGTVEFDHVAFAYPHTGRTVLHDVTFTLPAGHVVALVGFTGAGKSSIAKLLARMYDPSEGAVRVDGIDLRDVDLDAYRTQLGIVPQDAFVFRGTVATNVAYGRPDATWDEIHSAVEAVGVHPVRDAGVPVRRVDGRVLVIDQEASAVDGLVPAQRHRL